jgi:hypothetical protein
MKLFDKIEALDLYSWRERAILALGRMAEITQGDLPDERGLLCLVADNLWGVCDAEARSFLLAHPHHFVRSCAAIAAIAASGSTSPTLCSFGSSSMLNSLS